MKERLLSLSSGSASPAMKPLSLLYGGAMRARAALYSRGLLSSFDAGVPVISVGNITTGGTGKTPVVAWVAEALAQEGFRVCVLTRGYGRRDESSMVLVSDGERVRSDATEGGDEPLLLAEMLKGRAAVVSHKNRVEAARWARLNLSTDLFVLDDGFQHFRLRRDVDIVTLDGTNPWGGGKLLPEGRLREPPESLKRAGIIIITRSEQAAGLSALKREVESLSGRKAFISRTRIRTVRPLAQEAAPQGAASSPSSYRVAAFCALGNPQAFFNNLEKNGFDLLSTQALADHHVYTQSDIEGIERQARARGAEALLTTAKDAVKLRPLKFELPCFVVDIELEFEDERALREMLRKAVLKSKEKTQE